MKASKEHWYDKALTQQQLFRLVCVRFNDIYLRYRHLLPLRKINCLGFGPVSLRIHA